MSAHRPSAGGGDDVAEVTVTRIGYGDHPSQFADLHLPPGDGPVPVVVTIHGGFWRAAYGAELGTPLARDLVEHGVAAWNIEYRRVGGGGGYPETLQDVAAAIDALGDVGEQRLDLGNVRCVGHSAGGQLAVWAAARGVVPPGAPGAAPRVVLRSVVSQAGVLDLARGWREDLGDGAVGRFVGGGPDDVPERYRVASPAQLLPVGVPVVCVHGEADANVPINQSESYVAAALAAGDPARLIRLPGVDHFPLIAPGSPAWAQCRAALLAG